VFQSSSWSIAPLGCPKFVQPFGPRRISQETDVQDELRPVAAGHPQNPLWIGNSARHPELLGRCVRKFELTPESMTVKRR
jgi:hypothetical protein